MLINEAYGTIGADLRPNPSSSSLCEKVLLVSDMPHRGMQSAQGLREFTDIIISKVSLLKVTGGDKIKALSKFSVIPILAYKMFVTVAMNRLCFFRHYGQICAEVFRTMWEK